MVKKTAISSFLREDFGVEDFVSGRALNNSGAMSLESVALSNSLGLLSALADRADTNTDTFAMAAESYLGESNSLGIIADNFINSINSRFATAVEISKFGVEGFDAFAYGMEDFGEKVKGFFKAIGAAFKKMIQAIVNFVRQVANFIGSQFAKGQSKYYDKFEKDIKTSIDATKGKTIKCRSINISSVKALTESFLNPIKKYTSIVDTFEKNLSKWGSDSYIAKDFENKVSGYGDEKINNSYDILSFDNIQGKEKVSLAKVNKPSEIGAALVFGTNKVREIKAGAYLKENQSAIGLLSKDGLEEMKAYNKVGQDMIKNLNKSLKSLNKASEEIYKDYKAKDKDDRDKDEKKAEKDNLKARRKVMREISLIRNTSGKLTGILFSSYSALLKARSYLASAVKNYGTKDNKKVEKLNEAYKKIGA